MPNESKHPRGIIRDLSKAMDMHFVYAFFFEFGDNVHVKVGESRTPYKRMGQIAQHSPFPLSAAVFTHIGGFALARRFELRLMDRLADRRTRGEWYCFPKQDGKAFSQVIAVVYMECTGRKLKWTNVDLTEYRAEQLEAAKKWKGSRDAA